MIRHLRCTSWVLALCMLCQWMAPTRMTPVASAWAAVTGVTCNATMTSINFGNVDPSSLGIGLNGNGGSNLNTTGFLTYYCTNTNATPQTITACFSIGNPGGGASRSMTGPNSSKLSYNIYQDAARSIPWGSKYQTTWGSPVAANITIPAKGTSPPVTVPAYATIASNQAVGLLGLSTGSYSANYAAGDVALDTASGANAPCSAASGGGNAFTFSVLANVQQTCQVTTNPMAFPTPVNGNPSGATSSTTLTVTCTLHTGYQVGLDNGKNFDGTTRRMRGGPTYSDYIGYGLYQDSGDTIPWGNQAGTGGNTRTGTSSTQTFTVYGKVNPTTPAMPAAGNYFDAVTVYVYY